MNRSKDIETEWISLAPGLAPVGYIQVPYRIPEGYFDGFWDRLIMRLRTEESGGFPLDATREESAGAEMESISPLLAGLSRKTPYQVPENYFAQFRVSGEKDAGIVADFRSSLPLETGIADSGKEDEKTKVAPAPVIRMKTHSAWRRIGVAAAITAMILTSAFFYFRPAAVNTVAGELAKVSDEDMENFIATQDLAPDGAADTALPAGAITAQASFTDNEISDLMSNVSDNELQAYASNEGSNDGQDSNMN